MEFDLDLMPLLMASPDLDTVEADLRASGHIAQADDLLKLQQDAGVQMSGEPLDQPAPGPESAKLQKNFEPVTTARLAEVLSQTYAVCNDADKIVIATVAGDFNINPAIVSVRPPSDFRP